MPPSRPRRPHRPRADSVRAVPVDADVTIETIGINGDGIARLDQRRIFVPGAAPGDVVHVDRCKGDHAVGTQLKSAGPDRITPPCPQAEICGGCRLQHVAPDALAAIKRDWVQTALRQQGLGEVLVAPVHTIPAASRRRAELVARRHKNALQIGFHRANSRDISPINGCLVLSPGLMSALPGVEALALQMLVDQEQADLHLTETATGLDLVLTRPRPLDLTDREAIAALATTQDWARVSWRPDARQSAEPVITRRTPEIMFGLARLGLPPASFLQASQTAEQYMADLVHAALADCQYVADLFCGLGSFGLRLAAAKRIFAADSYAPALNALRSYVNQHETARHFEVQMLDLNRQMPAADIIKKWDGVVFDPPRTGAMMLAQTLARSNVPVIAAVSCNPATLARDLAILVAGGYRIESVQPIDQFLWSAHIETVAVLRRN